MRFWKCITLLMIFSVGLLSCNNFDEVANEFKDFTFDPSIESEKLIGTWSADVVVQDGFNVTNLFEGFELTFNQNNTWTAINGEPIFAADGSWDFVEGDVNSLDFGDIFLADIAFPIDDNQNIMYLQIFVGDGTVGGRTLGLDGLYQIEFSKLE